MGNLALNVACIAPVIVCDRSLTYNATVLGGTHPYTYLWKFGDGGQSTLANPSHTYSGAGQYTVSLTVTDARGLRTVATTVIVLE
ncbi:MAG: PKD domain-containing protein [Thermoplasmata archaeon]|nr:PKD domain-containing protein [Thermoplasmata archaeon]